MTVTLNIFFLPEFLTITKFKLIFALVLMVRRIGKMLDSISQVNLTGENLSLKY